MNSFIIILFKLITRSINFYNLIINLIIIIKNKQKLNYNLFILLADYLLYLFNNIIEYYQSLIVIF